MVDKWKRVDKYTKRKGEFSVTANRVGDDWKFMVFKGRDFLDGPFKSAQAAYKFVAALEREKKHG